MSSKATFSTGMTHKGAAKLSSVWRHCLLGVAPFGFLGGNQLKRAIAKGFGILGLFCGVSGFDRVAALCELRARSQRLAAGIGQRNLACWPQPHFASLALPCKPENPAAAHRLAIPRDEKVEPATIRMSSGPCDHRYSASREFVKLPSHVPSNRPVLLSVLLLNADYGIQLRTWGNKSTFTWLESQQLCGQSRTPKNKRTVDLSSTTGKE
jgi:hypothetical protein